MTNGEKIQTILDVDRDCTEVHGENGTMTFTVTQDFWNSEYKEPGNTIDYRRAFKIACDLLNGDILYGVDTDKIYELMMQKDGVVSSSSYEEYILNHLQELDQGQYVTENCIACKYDETEEEDVGHCKKCLAGDSQFKLDKVFVQPTTKNNLVLIHTEGLDEEIRCTMCTNSIKSDRGCDGNCVVNNAMYKKVMDVIENHIADTDKMIESTTKNDSEIREFEEIVVEYPPEELCTYPEYKGKPYFSIKYKEGNDYIIGYGTYNPKVFSRYLRDYFMPSVTPQEPTTENDLSSELEKNSKKLEKDFGESDCISRIGTIDYLCKHCPDDGECFKDCDEIKHLRQIPLVTPKGNWKKGDYWSEGGGMGEIYGYYYKCSNCGRTVKNDYLKCSYSYCPYCGTDMREVEHDKR